MPLNSILLRYWGHASFRPLQEEIIRSVMQGTDTLALLPTGGGKSVCFQVPGLALEGMCLVISPLIALMRDQVMNLNKKGIPAFAIYSGMNRSEIDLIYNNCAYGRAKFLYVSPERIESQEFLDKIREWKVNLLAVDEAHCISQWGYDFRPPYLRIATIRQLLPGIPVLALTATATPVVVQDIQQKLLFRHPQLYQKSFKRDNLTYLVIKEEDKRGRLIRIIEKTRGSGIVYVRNRKKTQEIAQWLNKSGISAAFYHAGLEPGQRAVRQDEWIRGKVRVMVATNAFGMGIDKPDVRFVVHIDLPESLEAYFQEAGRAGRDEKNSYSVVLFDQSDVNNLKTNFVQSYPEPEVIRRIYLTLANYLQVPMGGGKDISFDFDMTDFCRQYKFDALTVYKVLSFFEKTGYLLLTDDFNISSRVHIRADREMLYEFQVKHAYFDEFIKTLLRSYGGLFSGFVPVRESELEKRSGLEAGLVCKYLHQLQTMGILVYEPRKVKPQLVFYREREDEKNIPINRENYFSRVETAKERMEAVISYVSLQHRCRSQVLLEYFGEVSSPRCGKCDVCLKRNKTGVSDFLFESVSGEIHTLLHQKISTPEELLERVTGFPEETVIKVISWLIENDQIIQTDEGKIKWNGD
ncbi:MAG: RecQ family ATP-dependent DNA helicase [Bacteroidetes bacterium]|nr:RecQ family ATP-dependent DNA helicase [Bacteroidota bacterium]